MRRKKIIVLIFIIFLIMASGYFVFNSLGKNKLASLQINSKSDLPIFVDGKEVGKGSYEGTFLQKETDVKIGDYEARVTLVPGIKTIINRTFDGNSSWGRTLSFEGTGLKTPLLSVITNPMGAKLSVDGKYSIAPISIDGLKEGKHKVEVFLDGYDNDSFFVNLISGYKLTAFVDLKQEVLTKNPELTPAPNDVVQVFYVKILSTPNGFLRVRKEPNTTSDEIGRAHDGEKYKFLDQDKKTKWFEIKFDASQSGWISDTYAAKVN